MPLFACCAGPPPSPPFKQSVVVMPKRKPSVSSRTAPESREKIRARRNRLNLSVETEDLHEDEDDDDCVSPMSVHEIEVQAVLPPVQKKEQSTAPAKPSSRNPNALQSSDLPSKLDVPASDSLSKRAPTAVAALQSKPSSIGDSNAKMSSSTAITSASTSSATANRPSGSLVPGSATNHLGFVELEFPTGVLQIAEGIEYADVDQLPEGAITFSMPSPMNGLGGRSLLSTTTSSRGTKGVATSSSSSSVASSMANSPVLSAVPNLSSSSSSSSSSAAVHLSMVPELPNETTPTLQLQQQQQQQQQQQHRQQHESEKTGLHRIVSLSNSTNLFVAGKPVGAANDAEDYADMLLSPGTLQGTEAALLMAGLTLPLATAASSSSSIPSSSSSFVGPSAASFHGSLAAIATAPTTIHSNRSSISNVDTNSNNINININNDNSSSSFFTSSSSFVPFNRLLSASSSASAQSAGEVSMLATSGGAGNAGNNSSSSSVLNSNAPSIVSFAPSRSLLHPTIVGVGAGAGAGVANNLHQYQHHLRGIEDVEVDNDDDADVEVVLVMSPELNAASPPHRFLPQTQLHPAIKNNSSTMGISDCNMNGVRIGDTLTSSNQLHNYLNHHRHASSSSSSSSASSDSHSEYAQRGSKVRHVNFSAEPTIFDHASSFHGSLGPSALPSRAGSPSPAPSPRRSLSALDIRVKVDAPEGEEEDDVDVDVIDGHEAPSSNIFNKSTIGASTNSNVQNSIINRLAALNNNNNSSSTTNNSDNRLPGVSGSGNNAPDRTNAPPGFHFRGPQATLTPTQAKHAARPRGLSITRNTAARRFITPQPSPRRRVPKHFTFSSEDIAASKLGITPAEYRKKLKSMPKFESEVHPLMVNMAVMNAVGNSSSSSFSSSSSSTSSSSSSSLANGSYAIKIDMPIPTATLSHHRPPVSAVAVAAAAAAAARRLTAPRATGNNNSINTAANANNINSNINSNNSNGNDGTTLSATAASTVGAGARGASKGLPNHSSISIRS